MAKSKNILKTDILLYLELSELIDQSKAQLVSYANNTLNTLFLRVGKRSNQHILQLYGLITGNRFS
jgi:hypothetical protein